MPSVPDGQLVIDDSLTNVPDDFVFDSHEVVQLDAEISVARHFT